MPYTAPEWADGDPSRPVTAEKLRQLGLQYVQAMSDVLAAIGDANSEVGEAVRQAAFEVATAPDLSDTSVSLLLDGTDTKSSASVRAIAASTTVAAFDQREWLATDHGIVPSSLTTAGQQTAINAACVALSAIGGGTLRFPNATEFVVTGPLTGANNVRLTAGPGSVIRKDEATRPLGGNFVGLENFELDGITFDLGPRDYVDASTGSGMINGLRFTDCKGIRIRRCTFRNAARAIALWGRAGGTRGILGCQDILIEDNDFTTVRDIAVEASLVEGLPNGAKWRAAEAVKKLKIRDNTIASVVKATTTLDPWTAFYVKGFGIDIDGNTIQASADTAIMLGDFCDDFSITNNRCSTQQVCIFLGAVTNGVVTGANRLTSSNDLGIHLYYTGTGNADSNVVISGNTFYDCAKNGILVEGSNEFTITGNTFRGCAWKADTFADIYKSVIGVQAGGGSSPDGVTITGNTIIRGSISATTSYGISVTDTPTNLLVSGNNVMGTGFTRKFRYGTLTNGGTWEVQTDVSQITSSKKTQLPNYASLVSTTPTAGAKCWHNTHGELVGNGNNWLKSVDGTIASGTTSA